MKKNLITLFALILLLNTSTLSLASTMDSDKETDLDFEVYFDTTNGNVRYPKSPVAKPHIYQDHHTLTLLTGCNNSTLIIIDTTGTELFSEYITEDCTSVRIPDTLEGLYEIRIMRGNICFYAPISL